jgi:hypothetical protein
VLDWVWHRLSVVGFGHSLDWSCAIWSWVGLGKAWALLGMGIASRGFGRAFAGLGVGWVVLGLVRLPWAGLGDPWIGHLLAWA